MKKAEFNTIEQIFLSVIFTAILTSIIISTYDKNKNQINKILE